MTKAGLTPEDLKVLLNDHDAAQDVVIRDDLFEDLMDSLKEEASSKLKDLVTPAGMGRGSSIWNNAGIRGDSTVWVTPETCTKANAPYCAKFIKRLIALLVPLKDGLGICDYSVQFAMYPGNGEGYIRHKDSFPRNADSTSNRQRMDGLFRAGGVQTIRAN